MKQYEYIYVPVEVGESVPANAKTIGLTRYKPIANSIVLTIEEAREMWNAAQDRACALQMGEPGDTKIFEGYLESKGVQL